MRRSVCLLVVLLLPFAGASPATGEEDPFAEPIRVLIHYDDVGLNRIWDGIKTGLEFANLPRAGREDMGRDPDAVLTRLEAEKPPLLFVVGTRAARALGERLQDVPRVYVDTAWNVNGDEFPPRVRTRQPARVLRQVTNAVKVAEVLRAMWQESPPGRPKGVLSWRPQGEAQAACADALALAAGFDRTESDQGADVILNLRLAVGEEPAPIEDLVARARARQLPLVSDDPAHWRDKASVLVIPNYKLLGRLAAEQGRLLLQDEALEADPSRPVEPVVPTEAGLTEIWVDLSAARAQGLRPPVPWLAGVDKLGDRRTPR